MEIVLHFSNLKTVFHGCSICFSPSKTSPYAVKNLTHGVTFCKFIRILVIHILLIKNTSRFSTAKFLCKNDITGCEPEISKLSC